MKYDPRYGESDTYETVHFLTPKPDEIVVIVGTPGDCVQERVGKAWLPLFKAILEIAKTFADGFEEVWRELERKHDNDDEWRE